MNTTNGHDSENCPTCPRSTTLTTEKSVEEIADDLVSTFEVLSMRHLRVNAIVEALRNERDKAFDQGYVCAVANIMNLYGEETVARAVLNANRPKDWSIIDDLDMKSLQPIFDHEAAVAEIEKNRAIRKGE